MTGLVIPTARGFPVPKGSPPPPDTATQVSVLNNSPYGCMDSRCTGPLKDILPWIFDLLPAAWKPRIDPAVFAKIRRKNDAKRAKFASRTPRRFPGSYTPWVSPDGLDYYCPRKISDGQWWGQGGGTSVPRGAAPPPMPAGTLPVLRTWPGPCETG